MESTETVTANKRCCRLHTFLVVDVRHLSLIERLKIISGDHEQNHPPFSFGVRMTFGREELLVCLSDYIGGFFGVLSAGIHFSLILCSFIALLFIVRMRPSATTKTNVSHENIANTLQKGVLRAPAFCLVVHLKSSDCRRSWNMARTLSQRPSLH